METLKPNHAENSMTDSDVLHNVMGEADAMAVYGDLKRTADFQGFAKHFIYGDDYRVARNALWVLTKASDDELSQLQPSLNDLIDLALHTPNSSVRRLSLNIVSRLKMEEDDLRTDFLDFCLARMVDIEEPPGVQTLCMKLAFRMCQFYPELQDELIRTIEAMDIEYYKPAIKSVRNKILKGQSV